MPNNNKKGHTPDRKNPMAGPGAAMMQGEKANDFKGTIKKLLNYMHAYKPHIIIALICAVASTIFAIVGPSILGNATTILFEGVVLMISGTGSIDFDAIAEILLFLLAIYLISAALAYLQGWVMANVATKISYIMRKDISQKINRMPLSYFDTTPQGDVLSRITNDVDTVVNTLNQSLSQSITAVVTLIGIVIMMITISPPMTLIALLVLPISAISVMMIVKRSQPLFKKQQDSIAKINSHVEEMYGGYNIVKAFNGEEKSIQEFATINNELYETAWKSQFWSGLMMPVMNFISKLGYVAVCIMGGFLALNGSITVGNIQSFIQYINRFTQPLQQIATISNVSQQTAAAAERVFEFLEEAEEVQETTSPMSIDEIKGNIVFKNVGFGYDPEKKIINDFSIEIEQGKSVAIVGPTGAGKTTIVKLLMRFYDVNSGCILIDGNDIRDFKRNDLRDSFGMVLQDTWLYSGSIMENIRYGRLSASDEDVYAAAKAAQVDHFVHTLPDGYDTVLNEEASNVSQGQKQLLTIARTIISDPKVLIFDEATSSVDTRTEFAIQSAMNNLMKGRTSFIIAHRLSTIRDADIILVMKDGDIVETGSHNDLLEKDGFYAELYNSQFASKAV